MGKKIMFRVQWEQIYWSLQLNLPDFLFLLDMLKPLIQQAREAAQSLHFPKSKNIQIIWKHTCSISYKHYH